MITGRLFCAEQRSPRHRPYVPPTWPPSRASPVESCAKVNESETPWNVSAAPEFSSSTSTTTALFPTSGCGGASGLRPRPDVP